MKGTIVGVASTAIACIVGIVYTEWRSTDPNFIVAGVSVSADMITLGLLMLGAVLLSILLILAGRWLWPAVRQRLKTRQRRFAELAPELRELQHMTLLGTIPPQCVMPSLEQRTRAFLILTRLADLGIHCFPSSNPANIDSPLRIWRILENYFEVLAVLADAGKLDAAKIAAETCRDQIREGSGK